MLQWAQGLGALMGAILLLPSSPVFGAEPPPHRRRPLRPHGPPSPGGLGGSPGCSNLGEGQSRVSERSGETRGPEKDN